MESIHNFSSESSSGIEGIDKMRVLSKVQQRKEHLDDCEYYI